MRIKFGRALIALGLILGGMAIAAPAGAEPNQQELCYDSVDVTERKYQRDIVIQEEVSHTEYEYVKQTKTVVTHLDLKIKTDIVSDWSDFDNGSHTKFSVDNVEVLESGNLDDWWEFHSVNGYGIPFGHLDHFFRTYRYFNTGVTRTVVDQPEITDTETTEFLRTAPEGEGWVEIDTRTVTDQVPADCPVYPVECEAINGPIYVSNLDTKNWNTDSAHFVEGGIKIWVDGNWDENYISKSFDGTLADLGTVLDIEADPIRYVGLHIVTDKGVIVYEEEPSYNNNLWSVDNFGVSSGMGYASFAPLADYVAANPDLHVSEIQVLYTHPEESFTVVNSVTVGCTKYVFGFEEEPEEEVPPTTVPPTTQPPVTTPPTTVPVDVSSNTQTNTDPQTEVLSENVEAEELAFTGSNSKPMAALGAILLAAGLGLVAFDRKRKNIA